MTLSSEMPRKNAATATALAAIDALPPRAKPALASMDIALVSRLIADYRAELRDPDHEPCRGDAKWRLREHFEGFGIEPDFELDAALYGRRG